jgi:hypothetical protein
MAGLYAVVWPIYLGPFVPAGIAAIMTGARLAPAKRRQRRDVGIVIACFMTLTFFYHWEEARFTWFYLCIVISFLVLSAPSISADSIDGVERRMSATLYATFIGVTLLGLLVPPGEYWLPRFRSMALAPARTWLFDALVKETEDRFDLRLRCGTMTEVCDAASVASQDPYIVVTLQTYKSRWLRARGEKRSQVP